MRAAALLLLLLAGCGESTAPPAVVPMGSWPGLAPALTSSTTAEAWTIQGDLPKGRKHFDYKETSSAVALDPADFRAVASILSDPRSFSPEPKPCIPMPGVKIRFTRPNLEPVWVFFCFDCLELFVYEGTTRREFREFDPSGPALAAVMKRLFPKDPVIQGLK